VLAVWNAGFMFVSLNNFVMYLVSFPMYVNVIYFLVFFSLLFIEHNTEHKITL
jgi:hypothetical protein